MVRALRGKWIDLIDAGRHPVEARHDPQRVFGIVIGLGGDGEVVCVFSVEGVDLKTPDELHPRADGKPHQLLHDRLCRDLLRVEPAPDANAEMRGHRVAGIHRSDLRAQTARLCVSLKVGHEAVGNTQNGSVPAHVHLEQTVEDRHALVRLTEVHMCGARELGHNDVADLHLVEIAPEEAEKIEARAHEVRGDVDGLSGVGSGEVADGIRERPRSSAALVEGLE